MPQSFYRTTRRLKKTKGTLAVTDVPDLHLKTEKAKHSVSSHEDLWENVKLCWENMSQQVLHLLSPCQLKCMLPLIYQILKYSVSVQTRSTW